MHLPLEIGYILNDKYEIKEYLRRIEDHNLYQAIEIESGDSVVLNEYIPSVCQRSEDFSIVPATDFVDIYELNLGNVLVDISAIVSSSLNQHFCVYENLQILNGCYIICKYPSSPVFNLVEFTKLEFEKRCELFETILNFTKQCYENMIFCVPNMENTGIDGENFIVSYIMAGELETLVLIANAARLFYCFQFEKEFDPAYWAEQKEKLEEEWHTHVLNFITSSINMEFDFNFTDFCNQFGTIFNENRKKSVKKKNALKIKLAIPKFRKPTFAGMLILLFAVLLISAVILLAYIFTPVVVNIETPTPFVQEATPSPKPIIRDKK